MFVIVFVFIQNKVKVQNLQLSKLQETTHETYCAFVLRQCPFFCCE